MYKKFYNLNEKPFKIVPNPNFLFLSPRYENALTYLEYGLSEKSGFIMLTGEIGMGKTTLIRYLLNKMESEMEVGVILNTNVTSDQILKLILLEFELPTSEGDKSKELETLYRFLIEQYKMGKQVLIIIDEAQNLTDEALEEVRMLSNLQSDEEILLQIMV
ncbi:MAG: AAA family ATPase, partial [Deltaproteobacteria bacterium]